MTTTKTTTIFEDNEIPDLVLETIMGFVALSVPMERWGEFASVSKRWKRVSKIAFKEAFKNAWPKFILPKNPDASMDHRRDTLPSILEFNKERNVSSIPAKPRGSVDNYRWAFTGPLSLRSVIDSRKPVGVIFQINNSGSVQVGAFLVHSIKSKFFEMEIGWNPYSEEIFPHSDGDVCVASLGACGVAKIYQDITGKRTEKGHTSIGGTSNEHYEVTYNPGGVVGFFREGKLHANGTLEEAEMIKRHGDDVQLVFGVGFNSSSRSAELMSRLTPFETKTTAKKHK